MFSPTAQDRCDRCGARARHKASKEGVTELLFCDHHEREMRDALLNQYWLIESDQPVLETIR